MTRRSVFQIAALAALSTLLPAACTEMGARDLSELAVEDSTYFDAATREPYSGAVFRMFEDHPDEVLLRGVLKDGTWNGEMTVYHLNGRVRYQGEMSGGAQCGGWLENEDDSEAADAYDEIRRELESLSVYQACPEPGFRIGDVGGGTSRKSIVAAVLLALLWLGEALTPMFEGRKRRVSHGAANLILGVGNALVSSFLFAGLILISTEWARSQPFGILHWLPGPDWLLWVLAFLLFDLWQYTWHRLNHVVPVLWNLHSIHHNDAEMDASSGVRFHTFEIVLSAAARMLVLPLLGITIEQLLLYEAVALPVVLFHHSNIRVPGPIDRLLRMVIVTPWMHWVHHSRWQPETDSNFSSLFSWWDRIFRTFRLRDDPTTIELGLDGYTEHEWRSIGGMLTAPFRPRRLDGDDPWDDDSGGVSDEDSYEGWSDDPNDATDTAS